MNNHLRIDRRQFVAGGGLVLAGGVFKPAIVHAQRREIQVHGPAATADVFKRHIFPSFEKRHECKIVYEGSHSLEGLQKLRANKAKPIVSAAFLDVPVMIQASADGLLDPLDTSSVPNMAELYPTAIHENGLYLNYKWPRASIGYYTKALPNGVGSWRELWDPKYSKRVLIPSPKVTQLPFMLAVAAYAATGKPLQQAQYDLDAAFKKLIELKPNILNAYSSSAAAASLIEQGEAWMGVGFFSSYVLFRTEKGAPIDLASPKEGSFAMPNAVAKIRGGPHPDLASAFIDRMLGVEVQTILMNEFRDSPTNAKVPLARGITAGGELVPIDWAFAVKNLEENTRRFDREIAL